MARVLEGAKDMVCFLLSWVSKQAPEGAGFAAVPLPIQVLCSIKKALTYGTMESTC